MRLKRVCILCSVAMAMVTGARSQDDTIWYHDGSHLPVIVRFFAPLFFPKVLQDVVLLRSYLRSATFYRVRVLHGDRTAVNDIFDKAMALSWGNCYEALFLCFEGTLDHRRFGVRLPFVGPLFWVPLTSEFSGEFSARVTALPRWLYEDTPPEGDRDKLQHFFGSALLTVLFESADASGRVGDFVEWGEDAFIVGGVMDERDRRANANGGEFGLRLLQGERARPADFFVSRGEHQ
jgi:hypothetical protein